MDDIDCIEIFIITIIVISLLRSIARQRPLLLTSKHSCPALLESTVYPRIPLCHPQSVSGLPLLVDPSLGAHSVTLMAPRCPFVALYCQAKSISLFEL